MTRRKQVGLTERQRVALNSQAAAEAHEIAVARAQAARPLFAVHVRYLCEGRRDTLGPWRVEAVLRDRELADHASAGIASWSYNARTRVRKVKPGADPWVVA